MASQMSQAELNIAEQFRRIEQLIADADARNAERVKADREYKLPPWQLLSTGLATGAAIMGAACFATLLNRLRLHPGSQIISSQPPAMLALAPADGDDTQVPVQI